MHAWKENHQALLMRLRKIYIAVIWLLIPVVLLFWLLFPISRTMIVILFWSYYALWQFWILSRSKTISWSHYARFFFSGIWIVGPITVLLVWGIHFLFADGLITVTDYWSSAIVGPIIEEVIKVLPLLFFLFVTGKERQLSLVDYALIGAAVGTGFQFMEEVLRAWGSTNESLLLSIFRFFSPFEKTWGFDTLFPGGSQYGEVIAAGHHVWTAFVTLGIGFAIHYRSRFSRFVWLVPLLLWCWSTFDHIAYNTQVNITFSSFGIELVHFLTNHGHLIKWAFVLSLIAAVYLDYRNLNKVKSSLPLLPQEKFLEPLTEMIELVKAFRHGPKRWAQTMLFYRERRAFGFSTILKLGQEKVDRIHKKMWSAYQLLGFALLFLLVNWSYATIEPEYMRYLAGVFDGLSGWWDNLDPFTKTGLIITTGATIGLFMVATGGGIIAAGFTGFGTSMLAKDVLDGSDKIANVIRNPKTLFDQAKDLSPQEFLIRTGVTGLELLAKRFPVTRAFDEMTSGLQKKSQGLGQKVGIDGGKGKSGSVEGDGGKGTGNSNLKAQFTKEQFATKPSYSPVPDKWTKKGGTVRIDEDGTWVYTNKKGQTVRYPDGYPDFTEYAHPTVKPVEIEIANPTNRPLDNKNANIKAGLNKDSDPPVASLNEAPEGYTWHHHQDGKTMILVDKKVHREFTHAGGVSIVNRN
ncbi:HNH endonuclease [Ornithinibacillus scapharcae]|uniref:HNH endonuclease n=1 Tax=Ornithinibacillus scapharcae TaxID=1147159 RepID=UPI000225BB57|nr:HNH endonuclease [Ornithinibacillus scapharcae]